MAHLAAAAKEREARKLAEEESKIEVEQEEEEEDWGDEDEWDAAINGDDEEDYMTMVTEQLARK